jgi:hypothetical protein
MTSPIRHLTEAGFLGKFYIDGEWRKPTGSATAVVVNPATEQPIAEIALGHNEDVDRAVAAAERAFAGWSCKPAAERAALLDRIHGLILERLELPVEIGDRQDTQQRAVARPHHDGRRRYGGRGRGDDTELEEPAARDLHFRRRHF